MAFMAWFLLILTFPIYPIAAGAAALAAVAVASSALLGVPEIAVFLLIMTVPVIAYFVGFKYERLAAHLRAYRVARWILRWTTGAAVIGYVLFEPTDLSGGEIFGVIVVVPLILLLVKLADIALEAGGPRGPIEKGPVREFFDELKWNEAIIWGFPAGVIGFLIGQDTRILFGLFCWAAITGGILGVKILFRMLGASVRLMGSANRGLGGVPGRIFGGRVSAPQPGRFLAKCSMGACKSKRSPSWQFWG